MSPQDWLTATQILATACLQIADFPSQSEALKVAMHMVQENKEEYGHNFPTKESAVSPCCTGIGTSRAGDGKERGPLKNAQTWS